MGSQTLEQLIEYMEVLFVVGSADYPGLLQQVVEDSDLFYLEACSEGEGQVFPEA